MRIVWAIAAAKLVVQLVFASRYGYFGDEMYHLACGEHLDWGYVDQPPLIALIAWTVRHTLGESLLAIRTLPAFAGAGLVVLAGLIAREMGARTFGMALAALTTACVKVLIVMHYLFTMNAFEPLFWMGCAFILLRIINTGDQRLWLAFGGVAGLGLQNKYSMAVLGAGIVVGLLLTPQRKALTERWIWLGGALAALLFLPNVLWNIAHDWPFLELMSNIRESGRDVQLSPIGYLAAQLFLIGPFNFLIAATGLVFLFSKAGARFRPLGWTFVFVLAFFILTKGKDYYAAPASPLALAAGAVAIERLTVDRWRRLRAVAVGLPLTVTALLLPLGLPVLSPRGSSTTWRASPSPCRRARSAIGPRPCRITSRGSSAGRRWWRPLPTSTRASRRRSGRSPPSSEATSPRPVPSTCSAPGTAYRRRSVVTRATGSGGRATTAGE